MTIFVVWSVLEVLKPDLVYEPSYYLLTLDNVFTSSPTWLVQWVMFLPIQRKRGPIILVDIGYGPPILESGSPLNKYFPTTICLPILSVSTDSVDGVEISVQLVLVTPMEHAVISHNLLKPLFPNLTLEAN